MESSQGVPAAQQLAGSKRKHHAVVASEGEQANNCLMGVAFFASALMGLVPLQQMLRMLPPSALGQQQQQPERRPSKRLASARQQHAELERRAALAPASGPAAEQRSEGGAGHPGGSCAAALASQDAALPAGPAKQQPGCSRAVEEPLLSAACEQQLPQEQQGHQGHQGGVAEELAASQGQWEAMDVDMTPAEAGHELKEGGPEASPQAHLSPASPPAASTATAGDAVLLQQATPLSAHKPLSRSQLRQQLQQRRGAAARPGATRVDALPTQAQLDGSCGASAALPASQPLPKQDSTAAVAPQPDAPLAQQLLRGKPTRGNRLLGLVRQQQQHAARAAPAAGALQQQEQQQQCAAGMAEAGGQPQQLAPPPAPTQPGVQAEEAGCVGEGPQGVDAAAAAPAEGVGSHSAPGSGEPCRLARQQGAQRRLTQSPYRFVGRAAAAPVVNGEGGLDRQEGSQQPERPEQQQQLQQQQQQPDGRAAVDQEQQGSAPITPPAAELHSLPAGLLQPPTDVGEGRQAATPPKAQQPRQPEASASADADAELDTPGPSPLLGGRRGSPAAAMQRVGQLVADLAVGDEEEEEGPCLSLAPLSCGRHISKRRRSLLGVMLQPPSELLGGGRGSQAGRALATGSHPVPSGSAAAAEPTPASVEGPQQLQQQQQLEQAPPSLSPSPASLASLGTTAAPTSQAASNQAAAPANPAPASAPSPAPAFPGFWAGPSDPLQQGAGPASAVTPLGRALCLPESEATPELWCPPAAAGAAAGAGLGARAGTGAQRGDAAHPSSRLARPTAGSPPAAAGRRERKVRFDVPDEEEEEEEGAQAGLTPPQHSKVQHTGRPGTPSKPPLPKMRVPAPPAYSRFGSTAFRRYNGPAGRRAALLSFVSDGANCVALGPPPPLPHSPLGAGSAAAACSHWEDDEEEGEDWAGMDGQEAGGGDGSAAAGPVSIPRRVRCAHALARRLSLPETAPSAKQRSLHELREAFMNARLADSWGRGEGWARLDLAGVELQAESGPQHQLKLQKLRSALEESEGADGAAKVMEKLEGEWRHLQRMRQRYAAGGAMAAAAPAAAAVPMTADNAGSEDTTGEPAQPEPAAGGSPGKSGAAATPCPAANPAPRSILKQPSPLPSRAQQQQQQQLPLPSQHKGSADHVADAPAPLAGLPAATTQQQQQQQAAGQGQDSLPQPPAAAVEVRPSAEQGAQGDQDLAAQAPGVPNAVTVVATAAGTGAGAGADPNSAASTPDEPLVLTADAAVELTPGPAPSRGLKMLQLQFAGRAAAGGASAGAAAGGPLRVTFLSPPPGHSRQDAGAAPAIVAGAAVVPRRQKASRGARLLQSLQAASLKGGSGAGGLSTGAAPAVHAVQSVPSQQP